MFLWSIILQLLVLSIMEQAEPIEKELNENGSEENSSENDLSQTLADFSTVQSSAAAPIAQNRPSADLRSCWVCFATEEDDRNVVWLKPCRCSGSTMWVHEQCLQRWVDEKQKGDSLAQVNCAQCATAYIIIYPGLNALLAVMERLDRSLNRLCPLMTGGIILASVYWTAVTFGAITVMQVMQYDAAMRALEHADYILLLIGLPTIPILLIVARMIRWEDSIVHFLYRHLHAKSEKLTLLPGPAPPIRQEVAPARDPASATRIICGALSFPTIAALTGRILFNRWGFSPCKRTLLGGLCFLTVKGIFKIYFKYSQMIRKSQRKIEDYTENASS